MVLGKLTVPGRPKILITVGQGPTALAVGAVGGCLDISTLLYLFSPLSPSLWETSRYRLKYCLKGPLNPKQPTNRHFLIFVIARPVSVGRQDNFGKCFITIQLLSVLRKHLIIAQSSLSFFFIGHHTGSKLTGTDRNGPNYGIESDCAGRG